MSPQSESGGGEWAARLEPLRREPGRTAILTDVDGTLAPIVERAEEAAVPAAARQALAALSERYALVGCISGRRAEEARRLVGLDTLAYAGNHGLELLMPGEAAPRPDPSLAGREGEAAQFLAALLAEDGIDRATYAGDDRTDLDAFRRLRELQGERQLSAAVCVGVLSAEAPAELAEEADVTVAGLGGWLEILEWLAG